MCDEAIGDGTYSDQGQVKVLAVENPEALPTVPLPLEKLALRKEHLEPKPKRPKRRAPAAGGLVPCGRLRERLIPFWPSSVWTGLSLIPALTAHVGTLGPSLLSHLNSSRIARNSSSAPLRTIKSMHELRNRLFSGALVTCCSAFTHRSCDIFRDLPSLLNRCESSSELHDLYELS